MAISRFSIRKLLLVTAIAMGIMLIFIGAITNYFLKQSFSQFEQIGEIDRINNMGLRARSLEKDFMLKETVNSSFFETGKSQYVDQFDSISTEIEKALNKLKAQEVIGTLKLVDVLDSTINSHHKYVNDFHLTVNLVRERGLKDYGLIGEFRQSIHNVESQFNEMENYYLSTKMLTLRRHEKDYLLRKDLGYQKKFHSVLQNLIGDIDKQKGIKRSTELKGLLVGYGVIFDKLIEIDKRIGLTETNGMLGQLQSYGNSFEIGLKKIHKNFYDYSRSKIKLAVVTLFGLVAIISFLAILLLLLVSKHIVSSIKRLHRYITRLGLGELPEAIEVLNNDEISQMGHSINILTDNLKNTQSFAIQVGNGNLESEVNVFGNKGDLGGALIEMRNKLIQVSTEREQQTIETNRRMWANEGMAIFGEILRMRDKNIDDLAFELIKTLVKYTKSNQAGIFIMSKEVGEKPILNLLATYAWERRKYSKMQVELNEGLVGTCALEAETTVFTDIPKDYIRITSGLGEATPTCLILVPLKVEGDVLGVIEMASLNIYQPYEIEFIEKVVANIASTLQMVKINNHTKQLLERTQQQAEELQAQEEEMRQNMEEMQATQEWLNAREIELKEELQLKDKEIIRIVEASKRENNQIHERDAVVDTVHEIFYSYFLIAELTDEGEIIKSNPQFRKVMVDSDGTEVNNIFDNSLPEHEEQNRIEWKRVGEGETYKGIIYRIDAQGNHIALHAVFSPVINQSGELEKVFFVGQKVGLVDEDFAGKTKGNWFKEFICAENLISNGEVMLS